MGNLTAWCGARAIAVRNQRGVAGVGGTCQAIVVLYIIPGQAARGGSSCPDSDRAAGGDDPPRTADRVRRGFAKRRASVATINTPGASGRKPSLVC
jgi:hypothetical protein